MRCLVKRQVDVVVKGMEARQRVSVATVDERAVAARTLSLARAKSSAERKTCNVLCAQKLQCFVATRRRVRLGIPTGRAAHAAGTALRCSATL